MEISKTETGNELEKRWGSLVDSEKIIGEIGKQLKPNEKKGFPILVKRSGGNIDVFDIMGLDQETREIILEKKYPDPNKKDSFGTFHLEKFGCVFFF